MDKIVGAVMPVVRMELPMGEKTCSKVYMHVGVCMSCVCFCLYVYSEYKRLDTLISIWINEVGNTLFKRVYIHGMSLL